jgi:hypothetical protein
MVMICGGAVNLSKTMRDLWEERPDGEIRTWREVYEKTHAYYAHYRAVLEGDITSVDFSRKAHEVAQTRGILHPGATHRNAASRREGLGPQDRRDEFGTE